jgi:hypothetical protein
MARVNIRGLEAEIAKKGYKIFKPAIEQRVNTSLNKSRQKLLDDFDSHPITQEIEGGPNASNISQTLGGYGNLFSFMGFEAGSDPISPIRSLLARSIKISSLRDVSGKLIFRLKFTVPTKDQLSQISSLPWSTESWIEAVEKGMSGLGQYLYKSEKSINVSRSGPAVQLSGEVSRSGGSSIAADYMTGILERMLADIENRLKRI